MSELEPERTKGARYTVGGAERTRRYAGEDILFPTQALTWSGSTGSGSCQSQPRIWGTPTRTRAV